MLGLRGEQYRGFVPANNGDLDRVYGAYLKLLENQEGGNSGVVLSAGEREKFDNSLISIAAAFGQSGQGLTYDDVQTLMSIMDSAGNDYNKFLEMAETAGYDAIGDAGLQTDIGYNLERAWQGAGDAAENSRDRLFTAGADQNPYAWQLEALKDAKDRSAGTFLEGYAQDAYNRAQTAADALITERINTANERLAATAEEQARRAAMTGADYQNASETAKILGDNLSYPLGKMAPSLISSYGLGKLAAVLWGPAEGANAASTALQMADAAPDALELHAQTGGAVSSYLIPMSLPAAPYGNAANALQKALDEEEEIQAAATAPADGGTKALSQPAPWLPRIETFDGTPK